MLICSDCHTKRFPLCANDQHVAPYSDKECEACGQMSPVVVDVSHCGKKEVVNHPAHYGGDTTYEAIKVIEAWGLGFCLGNTVKYICRSGKKGATIEDLKKARWYLDREIQRLEGECDRGSE